MKPTQKILSVIAAAAVLASAQAAFAEENPGADLYAKDCAGCHGVDGSGGVGPSLVGSEFVGSDTAMVNQILFGAGFMPGYADKYSDDEIAAVINMIRAEWSEGVEPIAAEAVAALRE